MEGTTFKIKADGSGYTKTLKSMRGDTEKFSSDVKGQMAGIGGALKAAFAYVGVASFKGILDEITELGRLARTLGDDFEGFQTLTNAARQFGVEAETVADALKDLNVRIQEGAVEGGSMAEEFAQLGLDVGELSSMMPIDQFYALSDAIQNAGGNMKRMGLDRINDAMFRLGPLAELGAAGIKSLGNEFNKYTDAQREMAEKGSVAWDNMVQDVKWLAATITGWLIPSLMKVAHTFGAVLGEGAMHIGLYVKGLYALFTGDFAGAKAAFSTLTDMTTTALRRVGDEIKDVWSDAEDKAKKGASDVGNIKTKRSQESGDKLEEEVNKQLAEQEKRRQALMDDEEKLLDLQKRRIAAEKELGELGEKLYRDGASDKDALKLAEATTKWEKLQTEEQKLQLELQKKQAQISAKESKEREDANSAQIAEWQKEAEAFQKKEDARLEAEKEASDAFDKSAQETADIDKQIEAEKRGREEIGMTDEQILKRRRDELAQMQRDLISGTFTSPEEAATAQLDIEQKKTEIENLESGLKTDPQTSIISSSLASIGGGGGVASFGNDPILGENKKQTTVLEGIKQAIESQSRGEEVLNIPEL